MSAVVALHGEDYYQQGKRWWIRLAEKNDKGIEMPAHHNLEGYLDAYIQTAGIQTDRKGPLFRHVRKNNHKTLTAESLDQHYILAMVKRRTRAAGMALGVCNHSFRATGITTYLKNGGTLEKAQYMAGHE